MQPGGLFIQDLETRRKSDIEPNKKIKFETDF